MSVDNQELLQRLELEISKYMDISTIFRRLKDQGYLQQIHQMFHKIFNNEHQYTFKELLRMASKDPSGLNIAEHYKMNSHIFKQNLTLISNLVIDDLWVTFNASVQAQGQFDMDTHQSLERIDELSTEQAQFDSKISRIQSNFNDYDFTHNDENESQNLQQNSSSKVIKPNKMNQHVQEYKDQLKMINKIRTPQVYETHKNLENIQQSIQIETIPSQSNRNNNQNISTSSNKINSQSKLSSSQLKLGISQNIHTKSSSYEKSQLFDSGISPTQQNQKTMQFLNQLIQKNTAEEQIQESSSVNNPNQQGNNFQNLKTYKNQVSRDVKFGQHLMAINQQENFNLKLQKHQKQKSISGNF